MCPVGKVWLGEARLPSGTMLFYVPSSIGGLLAQAQRHN
jgi:hypothetical protein